MINRGQPRITVVIPTLNEERGIELVLQEIISTLHKENYEIIVVDGCSNDRTTEKALENGAIVVLEPIRGYGRAYKTGFAKAHGEIIVTLDGDGSYTGADIQRLVQYLHLNKLDFASGNRLDFLETGTMSPVHIVGNKILSMLARILFLINVKDSQSGMWAIRKSCLAEIMPQANDMSFSQELKIHAFRLLRAGEVSIRYRSRVGEAKLGTLKDGLRNLLKLIKLWMRGLGPRRF